MNNTCADCGRIPCVTVNGRDLCEDCHGNIAAAPRKPLTRRLVRNKDRARFVITFDEYGEADTITRNGKAITSAHRDARPLLRNADTIAAGIAPDGFTFDRN